MSFTYPTPRYNPADPRNANEGVRFRYVKSEWGSPADIASILAMTFAGAGMVTRFYLWAWFSLFLAVSSIVGRKSLSSADSLTTNGSLSGGWSCLMFSFTAMFSLYFPVLQGLQRFIRDKPFTFNGGVEFIGVIDKAATP